MTKKQIEKYRREKEINDKLHKEQLELFIKCENEKDYDKCGQIFSKHGPDNELLRAYINRKRKYQVSLDEQYEATTLTNGNNVYDEFLFNFIRIASYDIVKKHVDSRLHNKTSLEKLAAIQNIIDQLDDISRFLKSEADDLIYYMTFSNRQAQERKRYIKP